MSRQIGDFYFYTNDSGEQIKVTVIDIRVVNGYPMTITKEERV